MTELDSLNGQGISRRTLLFRAGQAGVTLSTAGWLAACGGGGTSSSSNSSGTSSELSGTLHLVKSAYEPDDAEHWRKSLAPFLQAHPKLQVAVSTFPAGSMDTYLATTFAGSNPPDVILLALPEWPRFAHAGALVDLTPRLKEGAYKGEYENFLPSLLSYYQLEDKNYVLPYSGSIYPTWVNLDLLEAAGHADWASSYENMLAAAKAVHKGKTYGFAMNTSYANFSYDWWMPYIWQSGGDIYNHEGTEGRLLGPDTPAAWEMLAEMFQSEAAPKPGQYDFEGIESLFVAGRVAILPSETSLTAKLTEAKVKFRWAQTFGAAGPQGQTMATEYDSLAMPSKGRNQDAAWELIRYLSTPAASDQYLTSFDFQLLGARDDQVKVADKDRYSEQIIKEFLPKARSVTPAPKQTECLQAACTAFEECLAGKPAEQALKSADSEITRLLASA